MRYFTILSTILVFIAINGVHAQSFHGRIEDETHTPVQFANVVQFTNDSVFISGCVTDENGTFSMTKESHATLLKISFIGYSDKWLALPKSQTDLGTIVLEQDAVSLGEVTVSAGLPKVYIKGDAQVTDVENSVLADVGSGDDVLAKIPGMVKKDGGLEVFGKGAPLIFINNKQVRDMSEVEQLSSSEILRVELVTNPGARYDATVGSVVRIYTKKGLDDGFGLDLRSSVYQSQNTDLRDVLKLNYKHKGLEVFGSFDYRCVNDTTILEIVQTNKTGHVWKQSTNSYGLSHYEKIEGQIEADYSINENHLIGIRYDINKPYDRGDGTIATDVWLDNVSFDHLESTQNIFYDYNTKHQINGFYAGKIKESTIDFNVDYLHNDSKVITQGRENSTISEDRIINYANPVTDKLLAGKLTIGNPLLGGIITYGSEATFTSRQDDLLSSSEFLETSLSQIDDESIAVFAEYSRLFPFGMFTLGGRFEHAQYDYYVDNEFVEGQSKKYNHVYPNLSLTTQIKDLQLMFSYAMKTERPSYLELRNSVMYVNRFTLRTGNPYLKPCTSHNFSLATSWNFIQFVVNYQYNLDYTIFEWGEPLPSDSSITLIRPVNIDRLPVFNAYLTASPTIGIWNPNMTVGIRNMQWLKMESQDVMLEFNKPMFMAALNNVFSLPKNWSVYADLAYYGKGNVENMYFEKDNFICNLSVRKSFFSNSLSVVLGVSDLFNQQRNVYEKYHVTMVEYENGKTDTREVYLTLRYQLKPKSSKYRGTMAGENEIQRL